ASPCRAWTPRGRAGRSRPARRPTAPRATAERIRHRFSRSAPLGQGLLSVTRPSAPASPRAAAIAWRVAPVVDVRKEPPRTRTLALNVPEWPGHRAGQHVDVRLTAEDGYQAQRSYSIASAPQDACVELTVDRLDDGEVSPYLTEVLRTGDRLEIRG